jgi:hypothetical protein
MRGSLFFDGAEAQPVDVRAWTTEDDARFYLTQSINQRALESQLPQKIVNLLFDNMFDDSELTILRGG